MTSRDKSLLQSSNAGVSHRNKHRGTTVCIETILFNKITGLACDKSSIFFFAE